MRFDSRVVCEFERDTSKDNCLFMTLSLSSTVAIAAARGLLMAEQKNWLAENGGYIKLNRRWAYEFFKKVRFVHRKPTTAKSKFSVEDFAVKRREFLSDVVTTVEMEKSQQG